MKTSEKKLGLAIAINVAPDEVSPDKGWCRGLREAAAILKKAGEGLPFWRWWVKPGLNVAAACLTALADQFCSKPK
jgi:hypothetical protein